MTTVAANVTGTVAKINKQLGDAVTPGDSLMILESMKMEVSVEATVQGKVREVRCQQGQAVSEGDVLMVLE